MTDEDGNTLTFVATGETVETPSGTFEGCELWETADDGLVCQTWYADGVGIVKPFDTDDLIARCKDEFGIDLMAEVHSVAPKEREGA